MQQLEWPPAQYDPGRNSEKPHVLLRPYEVDTRIVGYNIHRRHYSLGFDGTLVIRTGYRWNGGDCAFDTRAMVAASLTHDVICELTNNGSIAYRWRRTGDALFREHLKHFSSNEFARQWRWVRWIGVRINSELQRLKGKLNG